MNERAQEPLSPESSHKQRYEAVMKASPDVVLASVHSEIGRLQKLLTTELAHSQREETLRRMRELGSVDKYARQWSTRSARQSEQSSQTFSEFMDQTLDDAFETGEDNDTLDAISAAQHWVGGDRYVTLVNDMLKIEQENAQPVRPEQSQTEPRTMFSERRTPESSHEQRVERAQEAVEQLFDNEFLGEIVAFAKNKTAIHVDAQGGFQNVGDVDRQQANNLPLIPESLQKEQNKLGFSEVVSFSELQEFDKREVEAQIGWEKKGMFGKAAPKMGTRLEDIPGSEHPRMIVNPETNTPEPTVRFRYKFSYDMSAMRLVNEGKLPRYPGFNDGRDGQAVQLGVDLPKSIADKLQEEITANPGVARQLVERLVLANNNGNINEEYWNQGNKRWNKGTTQGRIKPPYESLPDDWQVAIVKGRETEKYGRSDVIDYKVDRLPVKN